MAGDEKSDEKDQTVEKDKDKDKDLPCFIRYFNVITRVCAVLVIIGTVQTYFSLYCQQYIGLVLASFGCGSKIYDADEKCQKVPISH